MKHRYLWPALFLICCLPLLMVAADSSSPLAVVKNVSYVEGGSPLQKLDIYFQPQKKDLPVLVFIHGGAWVTGDKLVTGRQASRMAEHGLVFVSVNYRLSPSVVHPVHVMDCARAVRWVKDNIHDFGGDPRTIFISGYSAGGHLCALLACDPSYLDTVGIKPRQICGFLAMGPGGFDLDRLAQNRSSRTLRKEFYKRIFGDPSGWEDACPISHIEGNEPPMFIAVAEYDRLINKKDCRRFVRRLQQSGGDAEYFIIPGKTHLNAFWPLGKNDDDLTQKIFDFIETHR